MNAERSLQNIHSPQVDVLIRNNFDWVMGGKGQFNGNGHSFEELVEPSLEHLVSLSRPEDQDVMRTSYKARLKGIKSPEEQFRSIAGDTVAHWHRNMP